MWCLLSVLVAGAEEPVELVSNGDFEHGLDGWSVTQGDACRVQRVEAQVGPYRRALRLSITPPPGAQPWAVMLAQRLEESVTKGDRLALRVWLRSPDRCRVFGYFEEAREPWRKSFGEQWVLTPAWREYTVEGLAAESYDAGGSNVGFHLGYGPGVVEIAGVRLENASVPPEDRRPTADHPRALIVNGDFAAPLEGNWGVGGGDRLRIEVVPAEVDRYRRVARLTVRPHEGDVEWSIGWGQRIDSLVRKDDAIYFRAWMRSPDRCRVAFIYELARPPHTKSLRQVVRLGPEWREICLLARAHQTFRPGESQFRWHLGYGPGTIEIAGVRVENYGRAVGVQFEQTIDWFGGEPNPDDWRAPALERIERIRKGDLTVRVVDGEGRAVPGATVRVEQQRHHFRFGSAVPAARLIDTGNPDNLRFQQEVERLYNVVTFENDLKWAAAGPDRLPMVERAIEWCRAREIAVRGHCLLWGSYRHLPPPLRELRGEALLTAMREHVTEYATRMRGKVYLWDVVNEAGSNVEVWDNVGWDHFPASFAWARAADPDVELCYNDYGILRDPSDYRAKVAARIRQLLEAGAPVDVLGIQGHLGVPFTPLGRVIELLDEWAAFGKPLEITEFDLGCADDAAHGAYVRDFMTACFSHPSVKSFIMWGFWEGSHWRSRDGAAMFRRDWSKRPAQEAWEDLVFGEWWTRWAGRTDAEGRASLRAFHGRHKVMVEADGRTAEATVELRPGTPATVTVRL